MTIPLPSQADLHRILVLDETSGLLRWRLRSDRNKTWNTRFAGKIAGNINTMGYRTIAIDSVAFYAHRIVWKMVHDAEPALLDHKDGDTGNNAPDNLRVATPAQNNANRRRKSAKDFPKGVHPDVNGRFRAQIRIGGEQLHIGAFGTPEEAHAAYVAKAIDLYGEFARSD